jgi:hypothetical protein
MSHADDVSVTGRPSLFDSAARKSSLVPGTHLKPDSLSISLMPNGSRSVSKLKLRNASGSSPLS